MSRRPRSEMQFGSDSFLDVIANIVGILIILIVIAGLRVSQAPVHLLHPAAAEGDVASSEMPAPLEFDDDPALEPLIAPEHETANPAPLMPPRIMAAAREPISTDPPRELVAQADDLTADLQRLEQDYRSATEQMGALRQAETQLNERLDRVQGQVASRERQSKGLAGEVELQHTSFEQLHATADLLLQQIDAEEKKKPPVETLEHHVTPLSKVINGHEQHYRLIGNRVSEVPVASLSARLRDQIERRKDWLLKQRSHQGTVGPVAGYAMHYVVQRDNLGVLDEVRYGQGTFRISVSQWRIEPEGNLAAESAAEALRPGSQFYDSLINADAGTSLTFWVYPDSYALYRKLQRFAHEQGFLVAGRPLPMGIPISGSPNGSKSAGQ